MSKLTEEDKAIHAQIAQDSKEVARLLVMMLGSSAHAALVAQNVAESLRAQALINAPNDIREGYDRIYAQMGASVRAAADSVLADKGVTLVRAVCTDEDFRALQSRVVN